MINGSKVSVGTTAVDLTAFTAHEYEVIIRSGNFTGQVFIGDSSVTTVDGFPLNANSDLRLAIQGDHIYAISSATGQELYVLTVSV